MAKVAPESVMDPSKLDENANNGHLTSPLPLPPSSPPPRELPKYLADFKQYADSKCCYFSEPINQAELLNVHPRVAYQYQMKVLMEARNLHWDKEPCLWHSQTFLGSHTLGKLSRVFPLKNFQSLIYECSKMSLRKI